MTSLACTQCGRRHDPAQLINLCPCGGILYAEYDLAAVRRAVSPADVARGPSSLWRYRAVLPVAKAENIVSLGEGWTPLIPAARRGPFAAFERLTIKDESPNPTGTFKARGMSAAISRARELGATAVALPSAGNAGAAAAAYAARAGLPCCVFMPEDTPPPILGECIAYGARVYLVKGLINDCGRLVARGAAEHGWFDLSTLKEPYRVEGKKTMGYEVAEQMAWTLPDVIVYPTGGGTGLVGMWKAFAELEALGWIGPGRPRMVAVQAAGCQPVVRAFEVGAATSEPEPNAHTLASGLRVPKPLGDYLILRVLRESGGTAVAVTDAEICQAQREMAEAQGVLAAPEGAAAWAGLKELHASGWVAGRERILLYNTGAGVLYPEVLPRGAPVLDPDDPRALNAVA